jgi:hypothetical protein
MPSSRIAAVIVSLLIAAPAWAEPQLRRVVLSSGGVGQFAFEARVDGADTLTLDIKLDQVDDVLKSLVVIDPAGPISGVRLPGREPLSESFRTLPFQPDAFASSEALLSSLVGEHVRIPAIGAEGNILSVSSFEVPGNGTQNSVTRHRLTIATAQGIDTIVLEDTPSIEFSSEILRSQIATALAAIAAQRVQDRRTLEIALAPGGARTVHIAYVVQVPVWKTTYRLTLPPEGAPDKAHLQAYAVVENLSGRDWKNVEVDLTSGRPALFHTPLYQALFSSRPESPVDVPGVIAPPADEFAAAKAASGVLEGSASPGFVPPPEIGVVAAPYGSLVNSHGRNATSRRSALPGGMAGQMDAPRFEPPPPPAPAPPPPPPAEIAQSVAQVDFHLATPVTAASGQSLLLPIIDRTVPTERVSLFRAESDPHHPLVALRLTNDSAGALPAGLITLFEQHADGTTGYLGDTRIAAIEPGETRLASFAVDLGVTVEARSSEKTSIVAAKAAQGTLTLTDRSLNTTTYTITMPTTAGRTLVIEHDRMDGYVVSEPTDGMALTPDAIRITRVVPAGATETLRLTLERKSVEYRSLDANDSVDLHVLATGDDVPQALRAAMQHAETLEADITHKQSALDALHSHQQAIVTDQMRVRSNLASVPFNSQLHTRYLSMLEGQETELGTLGDQTDAAERQLDQAKDALKAFLANLNI